MDFVISSVSTKLSPPNQVDNLLLVDQWASLTSSTPTATLSDITEGVLYSVKLEYKERFLAQVNPQP